MPIQFWKLYFVVPRSWAATYQIPAHTCNLWILVPCLILFLLNPLNYSVHNQVDWSIDVTFESLTLKKPPWFRLCLNWIITASRSPLEHEQVQRKISNHFQTLSISSALRTPKGVWLVPPTGTLHCGHRAASIDIPHSPIVNCDRQGHSCASLYTCPREKWN